MGRLQLYSPSPYPSPLPSHISPNLNLILPPPLSPPSSSFILTYSSPPPLFPLSCPLPPTPLFPLSPPPSPLPFLFRPSTPFRMDCTPHHITHQHTTPHHTGRHLRRRVFFRRPLHHAGVPHALHHWRQALELQQRPDDASGARLAPHQSIAVVCRDHSERLHGELKLG